MVTLRLACICMMWEVDIFHVVELYDKISHILSSPTQHTLVEEWGFSTFDTLALKSDLS